MPVKMLFEIYLFLSARGILAILYRAMYEGCLWNRFTKESILDEGGGEAARETAIGFMEGALPHMMLMMIHNLHTPSIKIDTRA